jgi:hypothetical protein
VPGKCFQRLVPPGVGQQQQVAGTGQGREQSPGNPCEESKDRGFLFQAGPPEARKSGFPSGSLPQVHPSLTIDPFIWPIVMAIVVAFQFD